MDQSYLGALTVKRVHTISRPGACHGHDHFPYTFQCAKTRRCISDAQMWNDVHDCCGEGNEENCEDTSDEGEFCAPNALRILLVHRSSARSDAGVVPRLPIVRILREGPTSLR